MNLEFKYSSRPFTYSEDERVFAIHEAGHAIVGATCGHAFGRVKIGPGPKDNEVDFEHGPISANEEESVWSAEELRCWQTIYAVGAAAEHIVFREIRERGIIEDKKHHKSIGLNGIAESFESAITRGVQILTEADIECVAGKLLERQQLTSEEVFRLIGVTPPYEMPGWKAGDFYACEFCHNSPPV